MTGSGLLGADRTKALVLDDPQEPFLNTQGELSDLVEKKGPFISKGDQTFVVVDRTSEGALDVTEQGALDQIFGQDGTVHSDEALLTAAAVEMDSPGKELLAGSGLSGDQNGMVPQSPVPQSLEDLLHRLAVADDVLPPGHGPLVPDQAGLSVFKGSGQGQPDVLHGHRFLDVVKRPLGQSEFSSLQVSEASDDDHFRPGFLMQKAGQTLQPAAVREVNVKQDRGKGMVSEELSRLIQGMGTHGHMPGLLDRIGQEFTDVFLIIDNENFRHEVHSSQALPDHLLFGRVQQPLFSQLQVWEYQKL